MHTYASLHDAKRYATDEGIAWGEGSSNDALALACLESVSRRVEDACRRSEFGSGFGPRVGTNRYDATGGRTLDLLDDLIATTSITFRASTGSSTTSTPAVETDLYLVNQKGHYEPGPFRRAVLHGAGSVTSLPSGLRVVEWTGTWGHQDVTRDTGVTTSEALDASETSIEVSGLGLSATNLLPAISPGMTIRIDAEQMYVRAVAEGEDEALDTITVERGANGTTAASHLTSAPILRYVYDPRVVDATQRVWGKRWAARMSGGDGSDGGGDVGVLTPREGEETILRRTLGDLRLVGRAVFG